MNTFTIEKNNFLQRDVQGFYNCDYLKFTLPNNPDFLNYLKNSFDNIDSERLRESKQKLVSIMVPDMREILKNNASSTLAVVVVPRAKAEDEYDVSQLGFKKTIKNIFAKSFEKGHCIDGTDFIVRHSNTVTTHLYKSGYGGDGELPYPGITKDTCNISDLVKDKNILLIDDIYTKSVNIDEDAIQSLIDKGAKSVIFYAVAKTRDNSDVISRLPM